MFFLPESGGTFDWLDGDHRVVFTGDERKAGGSRKDKINVGKNQQQSERIKLGAYSSLHFRHQPTNQSRGKMRNVRKKRNKGK